jgi:maltose alpha-D-glucosyltransferase/alpha-amylase
MVGELAMLGLSTPARLRVDHIDQPTPSIAKDALGGYVALLELAGQRTAQLHFALSTAGDDPAFRPEEFSEHYQEALYYGMLSQCERTLWQLRQTITEVGPSAAAELVEVLALERSIHRFFRPIKDAFITAVRTRCHGNYRLATLLHHGSELVIGDFEGEFNRPISERRIKRSPLRDVAGLLRSLHNVAYVALGDAANRDGSAYSMLEPVARFWQHWAQIVFLREYFHVANGAKFLPAKPEDRQTLLDVFLLERSLTDLAYTLRHQPDRAIAPARGILDLLSG